MYEYNIMSGQLIDVAMRDRFNREVEIANGQDHWLR